MVDGSVVLEVEGAEYIVHSSLPPARLQRQQQHTVSLFLSAIRWQCLHHGALLSSENRGDEKSHSMDQSNTIMVNHRVGVISGTHELF